MKYLFFILLVLNLRANVISPKWYPNETNIHKTYSYGTTLNEAKLNASKKIQKDLNISKVDISDFVVIKEELFENKFFIKVEYINDSIEKQIVKNLNKYAFKLDELENTLMQNTIFFKYISSVYGYYPNIELYDRLLHFKENRFLIKKHEIPKFYTSFDDNNISLDIKEELKGNENFFIEVDSKYKGYITLARIYKGDFSILFKNKLSNNSIIFPNFKISDGLQISLEENSENESIFTIVIVCKDKKDFSSYSMLLDHKDDEESLVFSDFIKEITNCKITSKTTKVIK